MFPARLTATNALIIINIVVFLLGLVVQEPAWFSISYPGGELTPRLQILGAYSWFTCFQEGQIWRLISYQFLHASVPHILFNMLGLYFFGPAVERVMGMRRYLIFYLLCGVAGALCSSLLAELGLYTSLPDSPKALLFCQELASYTGYSGLVEPWQIVPLIGASAAVYGVLVATAFMYPDVRVSLLFPPITMRLRTFAVGIIGIAAVTILFNLGNAGGEAGHLGGIVMAIVYMKLWHQWRYLA